MVVGQFESGLILGGTPCQNTKSKVSAGNSPMMRPAMAPALRSASPYPDTTEEVMLAGRLGMLDITPTF